MLWKRQNEVVYLVYDGRLTMKRTICNILTGFLCASMLATFPLTVNADDTTDDKISIGVSIWGSTDPLGASCKRVLDAEAEALGVELVYVEQSLKSEEVVASVENLCAAGVQGIVICNSADAEMAKAIPTCEKNGVYLAQFFRQITDEQVLEMAKQSKYFLGETHEDEEKNGYDLCKILVEEKGCRDIGMISYRVGDATAGARIIGYQKFVEEWNEANPDDQVKLGDVMDDKWTADESRQTVENMIDADSEMDGVVVVGNAQSLEGTLSAINARDLVGKIQVVSTDFTENLGEQLKSGEISAMSGGHYADPYFSLMMVYNAIRGNYTKPEGDLLEIKFPMMYVASVEDYENYNKYFVESLPYNTEETLAISEETFEDLQATAASLSIDEVAKRHAE